MAKRSSFREKYRQQKKDLQKRHQESINNKDTGMYGSFFDKTKIKNNVGYWKCGEANHTVDIIPFICGDNMPVTQNTSEGDINYFLDLWIHRNVGVLGHPFPCLARNWGERCPICDELQTNRDRYTEDEWKAAKAKRRSIYFVWSHTSPADEEKGVLIWDVAHWFMEDKLAVIATKPKGGGTIPFYDVDIGKHVSFTRRGTGATNTQYLGHAFYDRDEPEVPDHIIDQTFPLDEAIIHPTYKELYEIFHQNSEQDEDEEPEENGSESVEEPVEEEPPFETDEAEEKVEEGVCPGDGEFGVDIEKLATCKTCANWDACEEEADRLDKEEEKAAAEAAKKVEEKPKQRLRKSKEEKQPLRRRRRS
jgi:hypothetical protein